MNMSWRLGGTRRGRKFKTLGVALAVFAVAVLTTIGNGVGSAALDIFRPDVPLLTYSSKQEVYECGTALFVPENNVESVLAGVPGDWNEFQNRNEGVIAGVSIVDVSIQGESQRKITLTGIEFEVNRRSRRPGAVFAQPCGDGIFGRQIQLNLDKDPPVIVDSIDDPGYGLGSTRKPKPIKFPWTVSLTDPLLLKIWATSLRCDCSWSAYIDWVSGGESGRINIDNEGRGYSVAGSEGLPHYILSGTDAKPWKRFRPPN